MITEVILNPDPEDPVDMIRIIEVVIPTEEEELLGKTFEVQYIREARGTEEMVWSKIVSEVV